MRSFDQIVALLEDRKKQQSIGFSRMQQVCNLYNSEIAVPLPELNKNELPAVANLATQGIDQYGMRIASVLADIWYPSLKPGMKKHDEDARTRKQAAHGMLERNDYKLIHRRRARWFVAYTSAPVLIGWNARLESSSWQPMSPLGTFPAPTTNPDDVHPPDCIFTYRRTFGWLTDNYPVEARRLKGNPKRDDPVTVLLYADGEQMTLGASVDAIQTPDDLYLPVRHGDSHVHLATVRNRAEVAPGIVPGRITLDRPMGMIDSMVGQYVQEAEFMALATIAARKAIFPDLWLVAPNGGNAQIVKPANGLRGEVGKVTGGTIQAIQPQPGYLTMPVMDRLRENQRLTAGIPSDLTGEAGTNVRTGRRASQLVSAVVDFPVQEAQEVFAASLREELVVAAAFEKAYSDDAPKSVFVSWKGARGQITYNPKELWADAPPPVVDYAYAGTDAAGLVIEGGQRLGMGTLSRRSFMEIDPLVKDAEFEYDRIASEGLRDALLNSIRSQAEQGAIPPADIARIAELVETDKLEVHAAVAQVQKEAQERQAQQVEATAPEAQPGLAMPGAGAESAAIPPPPDSMSNLNSLLMKLRGPQMTTPAEEAFVA